MYDETTGRVHASGVASMLVFACAAVASCTWIALHYSGAMLPYTMSLLVAGAAVFGAAYMLTTAAELIQFDLPNYFGIPFVAFVSMLPAYVIVGYYAVGGIPQAGFVDHAIAVVASVDRMLIAVGWFAVLAVYWIRSRHPYILANVRMRIELVSLLLATLYWFIIAIAGSLALYDAIALAVIFIIYVRLSMRNGVQRAPMEGVFVQAVACHTPLCRRLLAGALTALVVWTLVIAVKPFASGVYAVGGVSSVAFIVVFNIIVVAAGCALRLKPHIGLAALVAAAINGMSLLVSVALIAYFLAAGQHATIALDVGGRAELFFGASLTLYALLAVMDLKFSWRGALVIALVFVAQLIVPRAVVYYVGGGVCIALSAIMLVRSRLIRNGLRHTMRAAWRVPQDPSFNHLSEH